MKIKRKLYSDKKEEEAQGGLKRKLKAAIPGAAVLAGGVLGNTATAVNNALTSMDISKEKGKKDLYDKVEGKAHREAVPVINDPKKEGYGSSYYNPKFDTIHLADHSRDNYATLSHELGHRHYIAGEGKGIGKLAHKVALPATMLSTVSGIGLGIHSGLKSGENESLWNKTKHIIVPTMLGAPLLAAEGFASHKGIKLLKEAGASKEQLKSAKKQLGSSLGTYAGHTAANVGLAMLARQAGKGIKAVRNKKRKKDVPKSESDN